MIKIVVTQEDIDKGCAIDAISCPIARAINRVLREPYKVSISRRSYRIHLTHPAGWAVSEQVYHNITPAAAANFIEVFDSVHRKGQAVPFDFTLELPEECLK